MAVKDLVSGVLAESITTSTTNILVTIAQSIGASGIQAFFPTPPFYITIMPKSPIVGVANRLDSEIIQVTAVGHDQVGNAALTGVRAQRDTTAKPFSAGDIVTVGVYTDDAVLLGGTGTTETETPWINTNDVVDDAITPNKASFTKYSTTETVVGTWTDGKPIYRVVFAKTFSSLSAGDNAWAHNIANISEITNIRTTFNLGWDTNTWGAGDYLAGSGYQIRVNKTNFILNNTTSATNWRGTIKSVIEYTKTTD